MLTQLTVTASISMNKADAPQTDDPEAVGPMNSAEENALRYVAGWAISTLKKFVTVSDSDKSKTISATLLNMEESVLKTFLSIPKIGLLCGTEGD